jgi:error-prone DNA polymerase
MALRLGLRQIRGLSEDDATKLSENRGTGYRDAEDLWRRSGLGRAAIERLAAADALRSLDLDRRQGLWALKALGEPPLPLFMPLAAISTPASSLSSPSPASGGGLGWGLSRHTSKPSSETLAASLLPAMPLGEHVVEDYATTSLTIKRHPLAFLRAEFRHEGLVMATDLATLPVERRYRIAGLVLIRQRPGSANGVVFVTLEDETGVANLIVWPPVLERFRRATLGATLLYCRGRLQREETVTHLVADDLQDWTPRLGTLRDRTGDEPAPSHTRPFKPPARLPGHAASDIAVTSRDFR